ncbi:MAG TPA: hypothetical protein VLA13_03905, partial [Massilibacterium sp.]|nr:hypothetical protein [Massilibacterium sp.]
MAENKKNQNKKTVKVVATSLILTTSLSLIGTQALHDGQPIKTVHNQPLVMAEGVIGLEVLDKGTLERSSVTKHPDDSVTLTLDYEINEVLDLGLIDKQHMTYALPPEFSALLNEQGEGFKDKMTVKLKTTGLANGVLDSLLATPILGTILKPLVGSLEDLLAKIHVISPESLTEKNEEIPLENVTLNGTNISFDLSTYLADLH